MKKLRYLSNKRDRRLAEILQWVLIVILYIVLASLLCSCKSVQPVVSVPRNDSVAVQEHYIRDSVIVRDSVFVLLKGDTTFIEHWHYYERDRNELKADSTNRAKETITQLPPEKIIPAWAWWTLGLSVLCIILIVIRAVLAFKH